MNDTNTTYDTAVRDADFDDFADSATAVTSDASDADEIATTLAQWWQTNARDLPWRFGRTTPWGVLVSEVMSQQTQMGRVVPYWTAWMDRWPDAAALADAPKSDVITAWGRLGYPRRALRLQECAHVIAYDYADELPHTYGKRGAVVRFRRTYRGGRHEHPPCAVTCVRRRRIARRQRKSRGTRAGETAAAGR